MNRNISKYFWGFNELALKEAGMAMCDPRHPRYVYYLVTLLSRCDRPRELFSMIPKKDFLENWPKIRSYWLKAERHSELRSWWQTIYEQLGAGSGRRGITSRGEPSVLFRNTGRLLKNARIQKGLSQNELAARTGIKQPDISKIEEGKKNITLSTLAVLCKSLEVKEIKFG